MKLIVFFLIVLCFHVKAGNAQQVTLSIKDVSLKQIFNEIEKQSGYYFFYKNSLIKPELKKSIRVENVSLNEALSESLKGLPLTYFIKDNVVIIMEKEIYKTTDITTTAPTLTFAFDIIKGTVKDALGKPLGGVSVLVKGTTKGTTTRDDGTFSIEANIGSVIEFSMIGFEGLNIQVTNTDNLAVQMEPSTATGLEEVVVTALGITREKKSLGYATQMVNEDDLNSTSSGNVADALSGQVAGLSIRSSNNMGGSANIVVRGFKSLTGNNQALFIVDGVPVDNTNYNTSSQKQNGIGYDWGSAAFDINQDDVESISVLKGAAATALYGSRAANGVILITTKSGSKAGKTTVSVSSNFLVSSVDKSTFPEYQKEYGAGYGQFYGPDGKGFFDMQDVNGDGVLDSVVPLATFGSFGGKFDPNIMVYQWDAFDPQSPFYMKKKPWIAAPNGPITFFETPISLDNNLSVGGSLPDGSYRISYSNFHQKGLLPNSRLNRNNLSFKLINKFKDRFTISASANYIVTDAIGRPQSGSDFRSNALNVFRYWWQVNIDVKEMEDLYFLTGRNISPYGNGSIGNMYWERYENFPSDARNRLIGQASLQYDINDWLNVMARVSVDSYSALQEERINVGSRKVPMYQRTNRNFSEYNYDLMTNINKNLNSSLNLNGLLGINIRRNKMESIQAGTNGGLIVPRLFALSNSASLAAAPLEQDIREGINGYFGSASFGYKNYLYLGFTGRMDISSTLPGNNQSYFYPSVSSSFIFSNFIKSNNVLSFGKVRINYAQVGNSAPPNSLTDILLKPAPFGNLPLYAVNKTKNNSELKPEITSSYEIGVELSFFRNRINSDISFYNAVSKNQIIPVVVTPATGVISKFVNAGEIRNRGVELMINGFPIRNKDFKWGVTVNWAKNYSKVLSLFEGVDNLQLGVSTVSLNAQVGHPYGVIKGTDFVYVNGGRLINQTTGKYIISSRADNELGDINPDWIGGVRNDLTYKSLRIGFLIDIHKGGSMYSNDLRGGNATGAYKMVYTGTDKPFSSTGLNELGNPVRDSAAHGGGILLPNGVDEAGQPNKVRADFRDNTNTIGRGPDRLYVFDASYIKLRQVSISYTLPNDFLKTTGIKSMTVALVGTNLWIIHKNLPYSDPEAGTSSGNFQGIPHSELPATRNIGLNLNIQF